MIIIAGLGNPEEKHKDTRHNIGFVAIDKIKEEYNLPDFSFSKKTSSLVSEGIFKDKKLVLVKPQTFMNNSGKAIKKIMDYYKVSLPELSVFHDDIDIPVGEIKVSKKSGSAGHKGVQSIIDEIKTKDFKRFRIGIKPKKKIEKTDIFVLKKFNKEEKETIEKALIKLIQCL